MTDTQQKPKSAFPFLLAFVAGAIGIYLFQGDGRKVETPAVQPAAQQGTLPVGSGGFSKALATGPIAAVVVHSARREVGAFTFNTADGSAADLSKWKGRVVLLNLWATWCAPCRKEMPDLEALQKELGGPDFEVVALSVDKKGAAAAAAFLKEVGAETLAVYTDTELASLAAMQAIGLPATILIDRNGREAARLLGPAAWHSAEAITMVRALMAEKP
jgi:thiol-disulfide isomerase/thioredoxin